MNPITISLPSRKRREWALLMVVLALLGLALAHTLVTQSERALGTERDRLSVLSEVIADDIADNLATTNQSLSDIIQDHLSGPGWLAAPDRVSKRMQALVHANSSVRAMTLLDTSGNTLAASRAALMGLNFSHRDYFKTVQANPMARRLYVSAPFKSIQGDLVITIARMVPGPRGEFAGVLLASLDPAYFSRILRPVIYEPDVWALVVGGDGIPLLNFPPARNIDGKVLNQSGSLYRRHMDGAAPYSILAGTLGSGGGQRLMALRTIEIPALQMDRPLVIGLSRDLNAIASPVLRQAWIYAAAYLVLLLAAVGVQLWVQTNRRKAQILAAAASRARSEADALLALALRGASLVVWRFHVPSMTRILDAQAYAMLGYTPLEVGDDPDFWIHCMHPEDRAAFIAARDAGIDGSVPYYEITYRIQHRQGHWLWMLARAQAFERDASGRAITITGTFLDITALKTAEQEVVLARNQLLAIFDSLTEGVFVFDAQGAITHVNHAGRTLHGLFDAATPLPEMMANIGLYLPGGEVLPREQWPIQRGVRGDLVQGYEFEIRRNDNGKSVQKVCTTTCLRDESGRQYLLIMTLRDVSERKRQEKALLESQAGLRQSHAELEQRVAERTLELQSTGERLRDVSARVTAIVGTMCDGVLTIDEAGTVETMNPAAERMFGYAAQEVIGQNIKMLMPQPLQDAHDGHLARYRTTREARIIGNGREVSGQRRDGSTFPLELAVNEIQLGAARKFVGIVRDITVLNQVALMRQEALHAAESANHAKTNFLANMSHEIRSPLSAILCLTYLLEQAPLPPDAHSLVGKIRVSGRTLLALISDILDMSKIEAGQLVIEKEPFRLSEVMEHVALGLSLAAGSKNVECLVHPLPDGVLDVVGDALRLEQVLVNLCSNAVKFTDSGRIDVHTRLLSTQEGNDRLRFEVQDSGIGISPEQQARVFSAFAQADTSTTRRFGGTGLGLSICRQLVGLMGGEIGVVSSLGKGSEFWFTVTLPGACEPAIPVEQQAVIELRNRVEVAADCAPAPPGARDCLAGVRLLVVDDSDFNREVAQLIFEGQGATVSLAENGQEAIDWLLAHPLEVDLVLMDLQMPLLDGMEAARRLRQMPQFDDLPIVALTADVFQAHHDAAAAAGMAHFVSKPFDVPATVALIQRLRRPVRAS